MENYLITKCILCNINGLPYGSKDGFKLHLNSDNEPYKETRRYDYLKCPACHLWWVSNPDKDYKKLYETKEYWWLYHKERKWDAVDEQPRIDNDLKYSTWRLPVIQQYCTVGTVLEIGSSTGTMLKVLKDAGGYNPVGIEPCSEVASKAAEYSGCAVYGQVEPFIQGEWDMLLAFDVIEHLTNPIEEIKSWTSKLKTGKVFICELPDAGCEGAMTHGVNWDLAIPMEHIYQYQQRHIQTLLKGLGYQILEFSNPWSTERQRCIAKKIA